MFFNDDLLSVSVIRPPFILPPLTPFSMARRKAPCDTDMELSDLTPSTSATVHGVVVGQLSPVKTSRSNPAVKFFEGQMADGKKSVHMVCFEPKLRNDITKAHENGEGIAISRCAVQRSKRTGKDDLEIVLGSHTTISKSPKKIRLDEATLLATNPASSSTEVHALEQVADLAVNQHVTLTGKVVSVKPSETVHSKIREETLTKQDFTIADTTAICRGVLWEKDVGTLIEDQTYKLTNVTIRTFNGIKYISLSENAKIVAVDDIGEVIDDEDVEEGSSGLKVIKGEILGIISCDEYLTCKVYKSKVLPISEIIGECSKCKMKLKLL